eukprot:3688020-Amphidinium_carterae.1
MKQSPKRSMGSPSSMCQRQTRRSPCIYSCEVALPPQDAKNPGPMTEGQGMSCRKLTMTTPSAPRNAEMRRAQ